MTRDEIRSEYKGAKTEQEKGVLEERLWQLSTSGERQTVRYKWLAEQFGVDLKGCPQRRRRLLNAPQSLWDRIDGPKQMPLATAVRLLKEAQLLEKKNRGDIEGAVDSVLATYDLLPSTRRKDGRSFGRAASSVLRMQKRKSAGSSKTLKSFWGRLRQDIGTFALDRTGDIEEIEQQNLIAWLDRELRTVMDEFTVRVLRLKRDRKLPEVSRRQLVAACHTLHVDPPRPNELFDLKKARLAKKQMVRAYHPDLHAGDESMRTLYEGVLTAYEVVEQYVDQNNKRKGLSNGNDGKLEVET